MNWRHIAAVLVFVFLAGCEPAPTPTPTPAPRPHGAGQFNFYLPLVGGPHPVGSNKIMFALANSERGIPFGLLGIKMGVIFHRWECNPYARQVVAGAVEWPMVWSRNKNNFDYVGCFRGFLQQYQARQGRPYDGVVMCCNECDQAFECDLDPRGVGELIIAIYRECPQCRLVGPGYSKADDGQKNRMAWIWVWRLCADLCATIRDGFMAHNPHFFLDHSGRTIGRHLDEFCDFMEGEVVVYFDDDGVERVRRRPDGVLAPCADPVWPTVGRLLGNPGSFYDVIRHLEARENVSKYFVYSIVAETGGFDWMVEWRDGRWIGLRPMGVEFMAARRVN